MAKVYNTTDLRPDQAFERHVFHRDQFAHYLRWTHILKVAKIGVSIVDFGCGAANLLEVLYRNKFKQKEYIGIDIREKTIQEAAEKYAAFFPPARRTGARLRAKASQRFCAA